MLAPAIGQRGKYSMKMNQEGKTRLSIDEGIKVIDKCPVKFLSRTTDEGHNTTLDFNEVYIDEGILTFSQENGIAKVSIPISDIKPTFLLHESGMIRIMEFTQTSGEEWNVILNSKTERNLRPSEQYRSIDVGEVLSKLRKCENACVYHLHEGFLTYVDYDIISISEIIEDADWYDRKIRVVFDNTHGNTSKCRIDFYESTKFYLDECTNRHSTIYIDILGASFSMLSIILTNREDPQLESDVSNDSEDS